MVSGSLFDELQQQEAQHLPLYGTSTANRNHPHSSEIIFSSIGFGFPNGHIPPARAVKVDSYPRAFGHPKHNVTRQRNFTFVPPVILALFLAKFCHELQLFCVLFITGNSI